MAESLLVGGVMLLYGDVGDDWGWGDGFTPSQVASALVEHGSEPLTVRINSGGGNAFDGVAIYSLLKSHEAGVTVQVDGIAASAASLIAMAGTLEMREGSMLMIHDAATVTFGNEAEHSRSAGMLGKVSDQYATVYSLKSGMAIADCRDIMRAETWMSAEDAVKQKFADRVMTESAEPVASFDYRVYSRTPAPIMAHMRAARADEASSAPVGRPTAQKGKTMSDPQGAISANTITQADVEAARTAGHATGLAAGATAERTRISAILDHASAKGRETQARHMAFKTSMTVEDAAAILEAGTASAEAAPPQSPLAAAMAGQQQANLGPGGERGAGAPTAKVIDAAAIYARRAGRA